MEAREMDLEQALEDFHAAADAFAKGNPQPVKAAFTSTFRREDDTWKLVHRHADPISTPDPDGLLRGSSG